MTPIPARGLKSIETRGVPLLPFDVEMTPIPARGLKFDIVISVQTVNAAVNR
jgi:hypothetical protein